MNAAAVARPRGGELQSGPEDQGLPQSRALGAAATVPPTPPRAAWETDPRGPGDPGDQMAGEEEAHPGDPRKGRP